MRTASIYGLYSTRSPYDIKYIGKTVELLSKRLHAHRRSCKTEKSFKCNWMRKELNNGFDIKIILVDTVWEQDWPFWEIFYIDEYRRLGYKLTNTAIGGAEVTGVQYNNKAIVVLNSGGDYVNTYNSIRGASRELNIHTQEIERCLWGSFKRRSSGGLQFIYATEYDKNKNYAITKKPKPVKLTKEQFSESQRLRSLKSAEKSRKPVYQYDMDNNLIATYTCRRDVIDNNPHLKLSGLTKCICGKKKSYYGYVWQY